MPNLLEIGGIFLKLLLRRNSYIVGLAIFHIVFTITPFNLLRVFILRIVGANIGKDTFISPRARFEFPWRITIGSNSYIGQKVLLDGRGGLIVIGDSVDISEGAFIYTLSHDIYSDCFATKGGDIYIGDHSWICAGVKILPATSLGNGCVIGSNSVFVGKSLPYALYSGVPAVFLKELPHNRASNVVRKK